MNPSCPHCGNNTPIQIVWGQPTPDLFDKAQRGEIELGGCVLPEPGQPYPHWHCLACDTKF